MVVRDLRPTEKVMGRTGVGDADLAEWRRVSGTRTLLVFSAAFGLWLVALGAGLWSDRNWIRGAMVMPLTLASAQLFTLGHDAGHRSLPGSSVWNGVLGRLAFMPSVHVFGLWRVQHDLHHRFTNLRGRDFVWTPLSVAEYRSLPAWRRVLHRLVRHQSGLGLGLHYTMEIWAPRMLWPRRSLGLAARSRFVADAAFLYGGLATLAGTAWVFVHGVDPDRSGDAGYWASAVVLLFLCPLVATHWLIGFVIYLNHTHPDIVWYDDPEEWSRQDVQLEGSAGVRFAPGTPALLPRRIMHHTAHHVDPGVPLNRLKPAQQYLVDLYGDRVVSYHWSPEQFRRVLSQCKLYDFEAKRWRTYPETSCTT